MKESEKVFRDKDYFEKTDMDKKIFTLIIFSFLLSILFAGKITPVKGEEVKKPEFTREEDEESGYKELKFLEK